MSVFGLALSIPLIAFALALSALPVWLAARIVGAGRPEFLRVMGALLLATVLACVLLYFKPLMGVLVAPLIFVFVFAKVLETSYLGAFILCVLAVAFQACIAKLFG